MDATTQTQLKLSDAASQMLLAHQNSTVEPMFRSCINSFIAAARSVTFVMQAESADDPALEDWYLKRMAELKSNPLMQFFNESRVYSIHKGVVRPAQKVLAIRNRQDYLENKPGRGPVRCISFQVDGVERPLSPGDILTATATGEAVIWYFQDAATTLPGDSGNVFRLCEQYFVILKNLVSEWLGMRTQLGIACDAG